MNAAKTTSKTAAKVSAKKPASIKTLVGAAKQLGKLEVVVIGDRKASAAPKSLPVTAAPKALPVTAAPKALPGKAAEKALPGKAAPTAKITVLSRECPHAEGTRRAESWAALLASKDSAEYAAKGGAHKYLARWAAKGLITLG